MDPSQIPALLLLEEPELMPQKLNPELGRLGWNVRRVPSLKAALEAFRSATFAALLLPWGKKEPIVDSLGIPVVFYSPESDGEVVLGTLQAAVRLQTKNRALDTQERLARMFFDLTPEAVLLTSLDGLVMAINAGFTDSLGYAPEDIIGTPNMAQELWAHPQELEATNKLLSNGGSAKNVKVTLKAKDGSPRQMVLSARLLEVDRVECLLAIAMDVTTVFEAEARLEESNELLDTLFQQAADSVVLLDGEGTILSLNLTASTLLGYLPGNLEGHSFSEVYQPADAPKLRALLESLRSRGQLLTELVLLARNGTLIPTEVNVRFVEIRGQPRILAVARDLRDRLEYQRALRESEERYTNIFENSGTLNMIFSLDGHLVLQNSLSRKSLDQLSDAVGKPVETIFGAERGAQMKRQIDEVVRTKKSVVIELRFDRPEGEKVYNSTALPLVNSSGKVDSVQVISRDVTDTKQWTDRLLHSERLDSIGVLAGGLAHDFNNLLAGLSGNLELARMLLTTGNTTQAIERLDKAGQVFQRAKGLTRQLLTFSKGGITQREQHLLGPFLRDWAEFAFSGSDVGLSVSIAPELWPCECDAMQIAQAVDNLLINAKQASPPGGRVELRAENLTAEGRFLAIHVVDHGSGIPDELRKKIFDPFFTTKKTGTGLGIASTLSIAKQHHGRIELETTEGGGCMFSLILPATAGAEVTAVEEKQVLGRHEGWALVMDDNEDLRDAVGSLLEVLGLQVKVASEGEEALRIFDKARELGEEPFLVLLDLTIPGGLGGRDTALALRKREARGCLVAMSGYTDHKDSDETELAVFDDTLDKPFRLSDVQHILERLRET